MLLRLSEKKPRFDALASTLTSFGTATKRVASVYIGLAFLSIQPRISRAPSASAQGLLERVPVLKWHKVVQDGVDRGRQVVEEPRDVEEVLVDRPEHLGLFEVHVAQSLCVKWSPAQEEGQHNRSWKVA